MFIMRRDLLTISVALISVLMLFASFKVSIIHPSNCLELHLFHFELILGARRTFLRSDFTFGSLGPEECARTVFSLRKIFSLPGEYLGKKSDKFEGKTEEKEEKDDKDQVSDVTASSDDVSTSLYWDVWEVLVLGSIPFRFLIDIGNRVCGYWAPSYDTKSCNKLSCIPNDNR